MLKLSEVYGKQPKGYLPATNVYSNRDAVIFNGVCVSKLDLENLWANQHLMGYIFWNKRKKQKKWMK